MTSVLEEAQELIHGDRQEAYGHPFDDFTATAAFWSTWIGHKYGLSIKLEAEDVAWMMSLLKHSREANLPKRDNKVDAIGYIGTVEMVEDERARRNAPPSFSIEDDEGNPLTPLNVGGKRPPPPPGWQLAV